MSSLLISKENFPPVFFAPCKEEKEPRAVSRSRSRSRSRSVINHFVSEWNSFDAIIAFRLVGIIVYVAMYRPVGGTGVVKYELKDRIKNKPKKRSRSGGLEYRGSARMNRNMGLVIEGFVVEYQGWPGGRPEDSSS